MPTFEEWWDEQPISRLPDSERVEYLRDMAHRVWISAQQAEREDWNKSTQGVTTEFSSAQRVAIVQRAPALLTWRELLARAEGVFIENTRAELENYTFQRLVRAVLIEEGDRRSGVRPNYRIDDVCMDGDWRRDGW